MLAMTKVLSLRGALATRQSIRIESQNLDRFTAFAMTDFFPPKKILKKQKKRKKSDFLFYYLRNTSSHLIKNWCKKVFKNLLFKNFWLYLYRHSKEAKQIPCCDNKKKMLFFTTNDCAISFAKKKLHFWGERSRSLILL